MPRFGLRLLFGVVFSTAAVSATTALPKPLVFNADGLRVSPGTAFSAEGIAFVDSEAVGSDLSKLKFSWNLVCDEESLPQAKQQCQEQQAPQSFRVVVREAWSEPGGSSVEVASSGVQRHSSAAFRFNHSLSTLLQSDRLYSWDLFFPSVDTVGRDVFVNVATSTFRTTLSPEDWNNAEWIGGGTLLRGTFAKPLAPVASAALYATSLGCFSARIDGIDVSDSVLDPGFSTVPPYRLLYRAIDVTSLLNASFTSTRTDVEVDVSLGMCKYGYLNGQGEGQFCTGAHGSSADCRAFRMVLSTTFENGTTSVWTTRADDGRWKATTDGNPIRYSHLFHGEVYDANLEEPSGIAFSPAILYNTTDRTQTGVPDAPTLHTMPPIASNTSYSAVSVTPVSKREGFAGRFIAGSGPDVYWQLNSSSTTKHHVDVCSMCGADVCSLIVRVNDSYLASISSGPIFSCSMDPGVLSNQTSFVFDFGHNIAGYSALATQGLPAGATLVLRHAELVNSDTGEVDNTYCGDPCVCGGDGGNCANQTDSYTVRRQSATSKHNAVSEWWHPLHTYHGFRYVQLEGWPASATPPNTSTLQAHFVFSAVASTGRIAFGELDATSSAMLSDALPAQLNDIQQAILFTQQSNIYSVPTDCPQREKRGWMGDAQWTSGEASVNFDMAELYSNFVRTMGDTVQGGCRQPSPSNNREVTPTGVVGIEPAQVPVDYQCCDFQNVTFGCSETGTNFSSGTAGALPDVVPYSKKTYGGWPGDPSWQVAAAIIPWEVWRRTGNVDVATIGYETAKSNVDFLSQHADPVSGLVSFGYYGDWLAAEPTPIPQVVSFSHILSIGRLADLANITGHATDALRYTKLASELRGRWHNMYYDAGSQSYGDSQAANSLGLYLGAPPTSEIRAAVGKALIGKLTDDGFAIKSGALGTRYLFQACDCVCVFPPCCCCVSFQPPFFSKMFG
eukprot:INCI15853.1.p1 GENE.INCI15853.1~~INCI15853.1.p1  ORF type:complete len:956 (+),score=122.30 INCI15853.1:192-3059(+)